MHHLEKNLQNLKNCFWMKYIHTLFPFHPLLFSRGQSRRVLNVFYVIVFGGTLDISLYIMTVFFLFKNNFIIVVYVYRFNDASIFYIFIIFLRIFFFSISLCKDRLIPTTDLGPVTRFQTQALYIYSIYAVICDIIYYYTKILKRQDYRRKKCC